MGETLTDSQIWAVNCTKMRLAARLRPTPLGSYSAPPNPLAVIRGGDERKGKERVGNSREKRKRREGKDVHGQGGGRDEKGT